jgi:hypothetical protein
MDNFDEAINQAVAFHNIRDGEMNVITVPENLNCQSILLTDGSGN